MQCADTLGVVQKFLHVVHSERLPLTDIVYLPSQVMHLVHTLRAGEPGIRSSMANTSKYKTKNKEHLHGKALQGQVMLTDISYFVIFREYDQAED